MSEDTTVTTAENTVTEHTKQKCPPKRRTADEPKVSVALKRQWHAECFDRVPAKDKHNPGKMRYVRNDSFVSLKAFAKTNEAYKQWSGHKHGSLEKIAKAARLKNKGAKIALERQASKAARKKVKGPAKSATPT